MGGAIIKEGQNNTMPQKERKNKMTRQEKYKDTSTFHYYNANPKNRITDDCVIRAIATAMERPYEEVYRDMFEFSLISGYMVNDTKNIDKYLQGKGWTKHRQPRKSDNTKFTGKEFCKLLNKDIMGIGKKIVAKIGGHHIVCIKVTEVLKGTFKVHDIWDSTDGCIGNFWSKAE